MFRQKFSFVPILPALLFCLPWVATAQQMDPEYAKEVKQWTTKPEFMSPLVDHLLKSAMLPSPKDVLGYYIGAPNKLTSYEEIVHY